MNNITSDISKKFVKKNIKNSTKCEINKINNFSSYLIVRPTGGIGNRLRALASAYSICKLNDHKLIINWIKDFHCNCDIKDLITNINDISTVINYSININDLNNVKYYSYLETDKNGKKNQWIDFNTEKKIYIKTNAVINSNFSGKYINYFFSILIFCNDITNKLIDTSNMIGMHIRMEGGKHHQTLEADKDSNWTSSEVELLHKWREISHIDNFINQINNILHKNPKQKFYISTDLKCNYEILLKIYGKDTIVYNHRDEFDRSLSQKKSAIVDMINLSRCKKFFGSYWSSFSEVVTYFQDKTIKKHNIFSNKFKKNSLEKYKEKNYLGNNILKGNSVLIGCKNRLKNLLILLNTIKDYPDIDEIVIIDWNSDELIRLNKDFNSLLQKYEKIKVYTVRNAGNWIHTKVWNIGVLMCEYDTIYKIDCEVLPNYNFIKEHQLNDNIFYHGHWIDPKTNKVKSSEELQIVGSIFCKRKNLFKCNLWNENIRNYGWEDSNLYNRLNKIIKGIWINAENFKFTKDNDTKKNYHNETNSLTSDQKIQKNRILDDERGFYNWNMNNIISEYNVTISSDGFTDLELNTNKDYSLKEEYINKETIKEVISFVKKRWPKD